ncbi:hypothetical protein Pcinc_035327, partial [Petrolisthes cinctipes]
MEIGSGEEGGKRVKLGMEGGQVGEEGDWV